MPETNTQRLETDKLLPCKILLRPLRKEDPNYLELKDAIRTNGFDGAILVRPHPSKDGFFEVVTGWHRCNACKDLEYKTIPCIVRDLTDDEVMVRQIQENDLRIPTEPIEYARHLFRLQERNPGITLAELASMVCRSMSWVADTLRLLRLKKEYQELVQDGQITLANAYYLAKLPVFLQAEYLEDAKTMNAPEFRALAISVKKSLSEKKKQGDLEDLLLRDFEPKPHLRTISKIQEEIVAQSAVNRVLLSSGAKNAREGFLAALQWVIHMDALSIEDKKRKVIKNRRPTDHVRQKLEAEDDFDLLGLDDNFDWDKK